MLDTRALTSMPNGLFFCFYYFLKSVQMVILSSQIGKLPGKRTTFEDFLIKALLIHYKAITLSDQEPLNTSNIFFRALLRKTKILVLDEATAAVDLEVIIFHKIIFK